MALGLPTFRNWEEKRKEHRIQSGLQGKGKPDESGIKKGVKEEGIKCVKCY